MSPLIANKKWACRVQGIVEHRNHTTTKCLLGHQYTAELEELELVIVNGHIAGIERSYDLLLVIKPKKPFVLSGCSNLVL